MLKGNVCRWNPQFSMINESAVVDRSRVMSGLSSHLRPLKSSSEKVLGLSNGMAMGQHMSTPSKGAPVVYSRYHPAKMFCSTKRTGMKWCFFRACFSSKNCGLVLVGRLNKFMEIPSTHNVKPDERTTMQLIILRLPEVPFCCSDHHLPKFSSSRAQSTTGIVEDWLGTAGNN